MVVIGAALTANAGDIYWNGAHGSVAEPLDINDSQYWSGTPAWDNNMRFSDASGQTTYLTNTLGLAGWVCDIIDFKEGDYSFSGDLFVSQIVNSESSKHASVVKNGTWKIEKGFWIPNAESASFVFTNQSGNVTCGIAWNESVIGNGNYSYCEVVNLVGGEVYLGSGAGAIAIAVGSPNGTVNLTGANTYTGGTTNELGTAIATSDATTKSTTLGNLTVDCSSYNCVGGNNIEFELTDTMITGDGTIAVTGGRLATRYYETTGTNCTLVIGPSGRLQPDAHLTVSNFVNNGMLDCGYNWGRAEFEVLGEFESKTATYPQLTLSGATIKAWTCVMRGKDVRFVKLVCEKAKGDVFGVDEIEVMGDNAFASRSLIAIMYFAALMPSALLNAFCSVACDTPDIFASCGTVKFLFKFSSSIWRSRASHGGSIGYVLVDSRSKTPRGCTRKTGRFFVLTGLSMTCDMMRMAA